MPDPYKQLKSELFVINAAQTWAVSLDLAARIHFVLRDTDAPTFARDVLSTLVALLLCNKRRTSPVSIDCVRTALPMRSSCLSQRMVKRAVKTLVEDYEIPIGSSRGATPGYFFITHPSHIQQAVGPLVREIKSLARRCRALGYSSRNGRRLLGQLEVEL